MPVIIRLRARCIFRHGPFLPQQACTFMPPFLLSFFQIQCSLRACSCRRSEPRWLYSLPTAYICRGQPLSGFKLLLFGK